MTENDSIPDGEGSGARTRPSTRPYAGRIVPSTGPEPASEHARSALSAWTRLARRAVLFSIAFPLLAWFVGGWAGLWIGASVVAAWWVFALPRQVLWLLSVLALSLAPVALWIQGLPQTSVVGADFGANHWLAHWLVVASLTLAAFAGMTEVLRLRMGRGRSRGWVREWARRAGARLRYDSSATTSAESDEPGSDGVLPIT